MKRLSILVCVWMLSVGAAAPVTADKKAVLESLRMVSLPGGRYTMGVDGGDTQQATPAHSVTVRPFAIAATEVTFDQYDAFARATGALLPQDEGRGRGTKPVMNLTYGEMQAFITWLNDGTGRHLRLPSEAEWEYAARGGATTPFYWGDAPDPAYANGDEAGGHDPFETTAPVASLKPNGFGLYDTSGNVWERVEDCFHPRFEGAPADGSVWSKPGCAFLVARGGYFGSLNRGLRATSRSGAGPEFRSSALGFRLAEDAGAAPARGPAR